MVVLNLMSLKASFQFLPFEPVGSREGCFSSVALAISQKRCSAHIPNCLLVGGGFFYSFVSVFAFGWVQGHRLHQHLSVALSSSRTVTELGSRRFWILEKLQLTFSPVATSWDGKTSQERNHNWAQGCCSDKGEVPIGRAPLTEHAAHWCFNSGGGTRQAWRQ